ncbi:GbsR/MarR family transcriptional regulator [Sphingopyxis macrogoltabida]|uniref:HTH-type transcriptional regulator n=1 Tax=Sphingopyxis macrogoltabida TaxID=33050 RepID=A0AAC9FGH7_SPHMC|nr:MarR family transcriptional regulator [Sphingopyxis macrogoltabida]ALJ15093.1 ArsR family transcriptional regulator [Sphingopyxis macrogoltabida]AMU91340.1 ArsR family transcriptional regulator [Sphingopyxis macrogoltabida]
MTEINERTAQLSPAATEFILHWGNLGGQWGVNRSVAQIHALLFVSDRPLHAEEIANLLGLARSNVSNSIKELLGWRLIHRVPVLGDRRDHFAAETDIWEMVTRIAAGRKAREVDPAEAALRACVARAEHDPGLSAGAKARLSDMLDFVTTMSRWHDEMLGVPKPALMRLIKLGAGVTKLLNWRPGKAKDAG